MICTVNLSNRHVHVSQHDLAILFGEHYVLTKRRDLVQPGSYAAHETVTLQGPGGRLDHVRIVGPVREETQCEILYRDVQILGFDKVSVVPSGHPTQSMTYSIIGPHGTLVKERGLMIAQRHIHIDTATAQMQQLKNGQIVSIVAHAQDQPVVFNDVLVRVCNNAVLECHLGLDEGDAMGLLQGAKCEIVP